MMGRRASPLSALRSRLVEDSFQNSCAHQLIQSNCEGIARDAQTPVECAETTMAPQHVTHNQQRPRITDNIERLRD